MTTKQKRQEDATIRRLKRRVEMKTNWHGLGDVKLSPGKKEVYKMLAVANINGDVTKEQLIEFLKRNNVKPEATK